MNWNNLTDQQHKNLDEIDVMHRQYVAEEAAKENISDFEYQNKTHKTASLIKKHKEQAADTNRDLERQQFIKSMQETKGKSRNLDFDR